MTLLPSWFLIGLLAVFIGVIGSFFDKYLLNKYFANTKESSNGAGALIIFSSFFLLLLSPLMVALTYNKTSFDLEPATIVVLSGIINALWILLYLHALDKVDVSQAVPLFQTIPIFGLILGYVFFGEILSSTQLTASAIILLGAHILLRDKEQGALRFRHHTFVLMLGASFFVALSQVIFKLVAVDVNFWTALFWNWVGFIFFGFVVYLTVKQYRQQFDHLVRQRISALRTMYGVNALNEIFDNISDIAFLVAVVIGPIALVQSLNAYEPLMVLVLSMVLVKLFPQYFTGDFSLLKLTQKIVGVVIITIGSILLYTTF